MDREITEILRYQHTGWYQKKEKKKKKTKTKLRDKSILIENLVRVYQDCVNDLDLPAGICNGGAGIGAHEGGAENDGQVVRVHAVNVRVVDDAVQVEHEGAEGGIVGVGQAVDDGVKIVSANDFIFVF